MKKILYLILIITISCSNNKETKTLSSLDNKISKLSISQPDSLSFKVVNYKGLKPLLNLNDNKIHVVNFWATWCAPCVKELPYFEALHNDFKTEDLEVLLVSLDFPRQYQTKLQPFLKKQQLQSQVIALDDVNQNHWITDINTKWDGAIPATLIYKGDKRVFYEGAFTKEELTIAIQKFINNP